ncbi:MAG: prolipoprotein diacylglyceryl transferase [Acidaminobacteraceae bacterium]
MQQLFSIAGIHVYLFGVTIALGMLIGYFIVSKEITRKKLDEDVFSTLSLYVIIFSIIGARLYYVTVFALEYYLNDPIQIFMIRNGGMSIQGGIIGGVLSGLIYLKIRKANFKDYADAFVPGLAIGQFIGRIGCDVFGIPMNGTYPWGKLVNGVLVHPVQIYEALLDLVLFAWLWRRREYIKFKGQLFVEYIIIFGIIRGFIEFFRSNPIWIEPFTVAHLTSFVMIIIGLVLLLVFRKKDNIKRPSKVNRKSNIVFYLFIILLAVSSTYLFYTIR